MYGEIGEGENEESQIEQAIKNSLESESRSAIDMSVPVPAYLSKNVPGVNGGSWMQLYLFNISLNLFNKLLNPVR